MCGESGEFKISVVHKNTNTVFVYFTVYHLNLEKSEIQVGILCVRPLLFFLSARLLINLHFKAGTSMSFVKKYCYILKHKNLCLFPQIHLNSRGLIFSVGLLLASVFFTVSTRYLYVTEWGHAGVSWRYSTSV